jgi:hypothetical protein
MRYFGWMTTILLTLCSVPEIYSGLKTGSVGATYGLLYLWLAGEITGLIYTISRKDAPLIVNYSMNSILVTVILLIKEGIL